MTSGAVGDVPGVALVVVALSGAPRSEHLIREAARLARREGAELVGVHVRLPDAPPGPGTSAHQHLLRDLGGSYAEVDGTSVEDGLRRFAAGRPVRFVLGSTRRSRWRRLLQGSVVDAVSRNGDLEVSLVRELHPGRAPHPARRYLPPPLSERRRWAAWALVVLGTPALIGVLIPFRDADALPVGLLLFALLTVATAALGGAFPAVVAAVVGFVAVNWFLTPPFHTLVVGAPANVTALVAFLLVGAVVSFLVGQVSQRSAEAFRARREAELLVRAAASVAGLADPLVALLDRLVATLDLAGASVLVPSRSGWQAEVGRGPCPPVRPSEAIETVSLPPEAILAVAGEPLGEDDRRVLQAFAVQIAAVLERRSLQAEAARAEALVATDQLRTALLRAVSHDLRTPLASIKASVTSLLQRDVSWPPEAVAEFLATIAEETDRLDRVVGNLLDMGRLQAGALQVSLRPVALEEVVPAALANLSADTGRVEVRVDERSAVVRADPSLLERAVANVVSNALAWSPSSAPVTIDAVDRANRIDLRVIDRGPGVPPEERERLFEPFRRLGDRSNDAGAGLGLAVAKGFVEAIGGRISMTDTPGGGLTVIITLQRSRS
jgi:two-component system sensor histidine kinase KdpD